MKKYSLSVGTYWGTEIRLHLSMLLLIPYVLILFKPENIGAAISALLLIAALFVCVAMHELGHALAARWYGVTVTGITLWPLGGFTNLTHRPEQALANVVIFITGPLVNLLLFVGLGALAAFTRLLEFTQMAPSVSDFFWEISAYPFLLALAISNLSMVIFNLVPIYPLDGGQIARTAFKAAFGETWSNRLMIVISVPLALAVVVGGFLIKDGLIILTGVLLLLATLSLNLHWWNTINLGLLYFFDRGRYYLYQEDYDPAIAWYRRAIQRSPAKPALYTAVGLCELALLDFDQARQDTERALALTQTDAMTWLMHGELLSLANQKDEAFAAFEQAISLRPNLAAAYLDRGSAYAEQGDLARAAADFDYAVSLPNGNLMVYLFRSIQRYQMKNMSGAREDALQALRGAPRWMLAFAEIMELNLKGKLDWALAYYGLALQKMPKAYQAYQGRADACRINDRSDWALADYQRALDLAPRQKHAEIFLNRGKSYLALGQSAKAAADLRQAATLAKRSHIRRKAAALLEQAINPPLATGALPAKTVPAAPPPPPADLPQTTLSSG